jgi:hypothetical protein
MPGQQYLLEKKEGKAVVLSDKKEANHRECPMQQ